MSAKSTGNIINVDAGNAQSLYAVSSAQGGRHDRTDDLGSCRRRRQRRSAQRPLRRDYESLGERLDRRGIDIDAIPDKVAQFHVAIPSWGVGTGGTRFARFPGAGEPRDIFDKIEDCAVIQQLTRATPTVSLHIPWDKADDPKRLKQAASRFGLGFDAMNSNTFSDARDQKLPTNSARSSHADAGTRRQAVEHNLECIEIGKDARLEGADGVDRRRLELPRPGQFRQGVRALSRRDAARSMTDCLTTGGCSPSTRCTSRPSIRRSCRTGAPTTSSPRSSAPKAYCLVDLGHHAPNVNIEMIVARLIQFGKLGGFHFNDSKYGDDDLDAGSIDPYRLFLVFNELVDAEHRGAEDFRPGAHARPEPQCHRPDREPDAVGAIEVQRAYAQALLVDRKALEGYQDDNDALMATQTLKAAFRTDVEPILAMARLKAAAPSIRSPPIAPAATAQVAAERPAVAGGGGGIV